MIEPIGKRMPPIYFENYISLTYNGIDYNTVGGPDATNSWSFNFKVINSTNSSEEFYLSGSISYDSNKNITEDLPFLSLFSAPIQSSGSFSYQFDIEVSQDSSLYYQTNFVVYYQDKDENLVYVKGSLYTYNLDIILINNKDGTYNYEIKQIPYKQDPNYHSYTINDVSFSGYGSGEVSVYFSGLINNTTDSSNSNNYISGYFDWDVSKDMNSCPFLKLTPLSDYLEIDSDYNISIIPSDDIYTNIFIDYPVKTDNGVELVRSLSVIINSYNYKITLDKIGDGKYALKIKYVPYVDPDYKSVVLNNVTYTTYGYDNWYFSIPVYNTSSTEFNETVLTGSFVYNWSGNIEEVPLFGNLVAPISSEGDILFDGEIILTYPEYNYGEYTLVVNGKNFTVFFNIWNIELTITKNEAPGSYHYVLLHKEPEIYYDYVSKGQEGTLDSPVPIALPSEKPIEIKTPVTDEIPTQSIEPVDKFTCLARTTICTREYNPVCGLFCEEGKCEFRTSSTKCTVCSGDVLPIYYTLGGECQPNQAVPQEYNIYDC